MSQKAGRKPVAVVVELVVAAERDHSTETDGVREEDLCARVQPHLPDKRWKWCVLCKCDLSVSILYINN